MASWHHAWVCASMCVHVHVFWGAKQAARAWLNTPTERDPDIPGGHSAYMAALADLAPGWSLEVETSDDGTVSCISYGPPGPGYAGHSNTDADSMPPPPPRR